MNKFEKVSYFQYSNTISLPKKAEYDMILLPKRATLHSAGYDFFSPITFTLLPGYTIKIATGIKVSLDTDKFLAIYPRSSLGFKYRLQLDNTVGIVDSDYYGNSDNEGQIFIKITNDGNNKLNVKQGEAFAQGVITQYFTTCDDNSEAVRGGGIGSTTNNK